MLILEKLIPKTKEIKFYKEKSNFLSFIFRQSRIKINLNKI